jgi:hypothetical protein
MKWLLWKEYRQNRPILAAILTLLIGPHLYLLVGLLLMGGAMSMQDGPRHQPIPHWKIELCGSCMVGITLAQVGLGLIGGNAFAGERANRSAEFQGSLPLRRRKILAAKILLALLVMVLIWLPNMSVIWWAVGGVDSIGREDNFWAIGAIIAITGLVFFCAAWLASSIIANPAIAACAGLATPPLVFGGCWLVLLGQCYLATGTFCSRAEAPLMDWYLLIGLALCPVCFGMGTWLYLRQVEP